MGENSAMAGGAREAKGEFTVVLGPHVSRPGVGVEEAARAQHVLENRWVMDEVGWVEGVIAVCRGKHKNSFFLGKNAV